MTFQTKANPFLDSIGTELITYAKHRIEIDSFAFPYAKQLANDLSIDSLHLILNRIPESPEKAYSMAFLMEYKVDKATRIPLPWEAETISLAPKIEDPIISYWVYRSMGIYKKGMNQIDDALLYLQKSIINAELASFEKGRIGNLLQLIPIYKLRRDYVKAFELTYQVIDHYQNQAPSFRKAYNYYYLGNFYFEIEDYEEAIRQYNEAEAIFKQTVHTDFVGLILRKKAGALYKLHFQDSALVLLQQSRAIYRNSNHKKTNTRLGNTFKDSGLIFLGKGDFEKALNLFYLADSLFIADGEPTGLQSDIGEAYMAKGDLDVAEDIFLGLLNILKKQPNSIRLPSTYTHLARLYLKKKEYTKARDYALLAKSEATNQKLLFKLIDINELLTEAYFNLNDFKEAYAIQNEINQLHKEARKELKTQNSNYLKLRYRLKTQRDELAIRHELALRDKKIGTIIILIGGTAFIFIAALLFQIIRFTRKTNKILSTKNVEIASLNENLEQKVMKRTAELQEKNDLLDNYIDNLPGISFRLKFEKNVVPVFISKGMQKNIGFDSDLILNNSNATDLFVREDYRDYVRNSIKQSFEEKRIDEIMELVFPINGTDRWVLQRSKIIDDPNGELYMDGLLIDITDRINAESDLKKSQRELSLVYNNTEESMGLVQVTKQQGLIIESINRPFIDELVAMGLLEKGQSIVGMTLSGYFKNILNFSDELVSQRLSYIIKVIADKKRVSYETSIKGTNDQVEKILSVSLTPIVDEKTGACSRVIYVAQDITESKLAKRELELSEKKLSTIYNSSKDLIGLIKFSPDGDHEIESLNKTSIDLISKFGLIKSPQELKDLKVNDFYKTLFKIPENEIEGRMNMINQVFEQHKTVRYKSHSKIAGTNIKIDFEIIISPIIDQQGSCKQALLSARDITESEVAKNKLINSEKRLASIYNGAKDQMAIVDIRPNSDLILEDVNQSFKDSWKRAKLPMDWKNFIGKSMEYFIHKILGFSERKAKERVELFHKIIKSKKPYNYEDSYKARNNETYILDVSVSPILNEADVCTKLLFVIRDVTMKHKAKEKMISKILETEDRERSRFAKELHDSLGQHLTAASLHFNLVKKGLELLPPDIRQKFNSGNIFLKEAISESRNIAHNLMPQSITDFGYVLTIESLLDNLKQSSEIAFTFYDNLNGERLSLDIELSLYRVTQEALNNIFKHAEASGVIVQLVRHEESVILTIEDNGKGFLLNEQNLTSFGLNSMKNRASAHSGILDIDSMPGKGTSITIEIPVELDLVIETSRV